MRWLALLSLVLAWPAGAQDTPEVPEGQVSLDDVWCTVCHFEQGDEFALSVHYQRGLLLCNDCHGGNPFEPDAEVAKAQDTGFIGKPTRSDIVTLCAKCHSGPAEFFALGPHADDTDPDSPICVTCHQNHLVIDATLALMDTTCAVCQRGDSRVEKRVTAIESKLAGAEASLVAMAVRFDSLQGLDAGLRRSVGLLEGAGAALRQVEPRTHALDMGLIGASIDAFDEEIAAVGEVLDESEHWRQRRGWIVVGVWLFIAANVTLLWMRRRTL